MWTLIICILGIISTLTAVYITVKTRRLSIIKRVSERHKFIGFLLSLLPVAAVSLFAFINYFTAMVVALHLFMGFVICDIAAFIVRKSLKKSFNYDIQIYSAILLTAVYLGIGWFMAHHIFVTEYTFYTDKDIGQNLRIVEIADSHLGITLDGKRFADQINRVQGTDPDVVVIAGDFVDDDTKKQDMIEACRALGKLNTTYGVYFVFGNHDEGYYNYRNFTSAELRRELNENGVTVLEDESVLVDNEFYIVGRQDRSVPARAEAVTLTEKLDKSKYIVLLDHQPNDYDNETKAKADLVLSGHTHGGHIFPAGLIGLATGANDKVYGAEVRNGTTFVVTSGISGWAIPFKTGTFSEYTVIDIKSK